MNNVYKTSFFVLLILASFSINAEVYKWTDEQGQTHYSASPPPTGNAKKVKIEQHKVDQASVNRLKTMTDTYSSPSQSKSKSTTKKATSSSNSSQTDKDKKRCEKYKKIYEKYKREGVLGINPITGKTGMMKGEAAKTAIQNAKDNAELFCN